METIKRVKCCGCLTHLYKRRREQYCHRCHHSYNFAGYSCGYFGSGLSKDAYQAEQQEQHKRLLTKWAV